VSCVRPSDQVGPHIGHRYCTVIEHEPLPSTENGGAVFLFPVVAWLPVVAFGLAARAKVKPPQRLTRARTGRGMKKPHRATVGRAGFWGLPVPRLVAIVVASGGLG